MKMSKVRHPSHRLLPVIIVSLTETIIIGLSIGLCYVINQVYAFDSFINFIIFFIIQSILTLIALKAIRVIFPIRDGIYVLKTNPKVFDIYMSYSYMSIVNLGLFWVISFPGFIFRNIIYKYLGCKKSKTSLLNPTLLWDPWFTEVGENAICGGGTTVTAHTTTLVNGEPAFILAKIKIGANTLIGFNSFIMPGVTIGENSMVQPGSFVTIYTKIPPNEIWGGNPAIKISEIKNKNG